MKGRKEGKRYKKLRTGLDGELSRPRNEISLNGGGMEEKWGLTLDKTNQSRERERKI